MISSNNNNSSLQNKDLADACKKQLEQLQLLFLQQVQMLPENMKQSNAVEQLQMRQQQMASQLQQASVKDVRLV